ncbi:unnamed protein product [Phytophthora fragariaefolia]|uniref:Unnamed protein product n=1 Tax=Phytophthora fragariaefolia TaxID=1490495 RepID=A0A9W6XLE7_9STRA|nr:unnamed protein product [Phytophthora fragariaefolia]
MDEMELDTYLSSLKVAFFEIAERFDPFLGRHAERTPIEHLVSTRTLTTVLLELDQSLDSVQEQLVLEEKCWRDAWDEMVRKVVERLESLISKERTKSNA